MTRGYDVLMLLRSDPDWAVERSEVQFLDRRSDGIIFASPIIGESEKTFEALARHEIPAVVCYRRDVPKEMVWVDADNCGAMRGAVEYLVQMGHTRILHLTENHQLLFDNRERRRFFSASMREFGLNEWADAMVEIHYYGANRELVEQILATGATAVVAMNDLLAIDLKKAMLEMGLSVPHDLSMVGVDGVDAEANDLTSMEFSFADIGRAATDALADRLTGLSVEECCRIVPVALHARGSVKRL